MPDALVLELEGVLLDTYAMRRAALADALRAEGFDVTHEPKVLWHASPHAVVGEVLRQYQATGDETLLDLIVARAERAFAARLGAGVSMHQRVAAFLERAQASARLACVTALRRQDAARVLSLANLDGTFEVMLCGEDIQAPRPDPEAYRQVLIRFGRKRPIAASRCIAVESTTAGIQAAGAAGLRVVAVGHIGAPVALEYGANGYVSSLADATIESLEALAGATSSREPSP
jgi:HAD superfamily hydrolase (TIGR01509 family)